jgi:hypothetical protein
VLPFINSVCATWLARLKDSFEVLAYRPLPVSTTYQDGLVTRGGAVAVAADDLPAGAFDLAGAIGVDGQLPAHLVQHDVVVPPAVVLEVGQAGVPAVGPVHHVVRFAARGGLVAAAGELAALVPQAGQAAQVHGDVVGLALVYILYLSWEAWTVRTR